MTAKIMRQAVQDFNKSLDDERAGRGDPRKPLLSWDIDSDGQVIVSLTDNAATELRAHFEAAKQEALEPA